jgi:type IV pilus assembly protein PilX
MAKNNKLLLQNQSGAALVIALIILIVLTVISLSSSLTSITEIKLSGNKRGSTDAFYTADGGVQATVANLSNFTASTYTLIASTGGISQDILNQGVDSYFHSVTFAPGVTFTTAPDVWIYHEISTGAPRGLGFSATGNVGFEYYIVDSTGVDQTSSDLLRSTSRVITTAVRIMPSQLGGNL